jgi:hypothetical protein
VNDLPALDLGGSTTDTSLQFSGVRGVHRLRDGSVAVLDIGSYSLRFFDSLGNATGRVGRKGSGPGEFSSTYRPHSFSCGNDTIYSPKLGQVMVFAPPGTFVRQFEPVPGVGMFPAVLGCSGTRWVGWTQIEPPVQTAGVHRIPGALAWYDLSGNPHRMIGIFGMEDQTYNRGPEGWGYRPAPFGRRLAVAVGPHKIASGIGESFEIEIRDTAGVVREILRAPALQRRLTQTEIDRYRDFVIPRIGRRKELDEEFTAPNLPVMIPAFAEMRFDALGNLWVREYDFADAVIFFDRASTTLGIGANQRFENLPARSWHVFDGEGLHLGRVSLPQRFDVHEIGDDWILGVWRSDHGVEHVRLYPIQKPS